MKEQQQAVAHTDKLPDHCTHEPIQLLQCKTSDIIATDLWLSNRPNLNPVD